MLVALVSLKDDSIVPDVQKWIESGELQSQTVISFLIALLSFDPENFLKNAAIFIVMQLEQKNREVYLDS